MTEAETGERGLVARALGPYGVLRGNRNLALLFGGQVVSAFGDWLYILALVVLAYDLTGSATLVAALTFVSARLHRAIYQVLPETHSLHWLTTI